MNRLKADMIVNDSWNYHRLSSTILPFERGPVPWIGIGSWSHISYKGVSFAFPPLSLQTSWFAGRAKLQECGRRAEKEEESQRTPAEIPTTYGQAFFVSSLSTLSSNTEKWMWATKSACAKTKNTGTRRNTRTPEHRNTGTPEHRNTPEHGNTPEHPGTTEQLKNPGSPN